MIVTEEPIERLEEHGRVSAAFTVERILEVAVMEQGLGGLCLVERPVEDPWRKDYDAVGDGGPAAWRGRFDVGSWGLFGAYDGEVRIGGAVVAVDTTGLDLLAGRYVLCFGTSEFAVTRAAPAPAHGSFGPQKPGSTVAGAAPSTSRLRTSTWQRAASTFAWVVNWQP